ncbi:MAG: hypothetical protein JSU86_14830 [Phycisphaerales bacterium]|nr:MAG: hypothetical protein JSU86_14830 [Phycisphaerales bacterium]
MRNHRTAMFAGAGSVVAATLVIAASLLIPTSGSTVEADTIFASFREAMGNAFSISFKDIGDQEGRVNGEVVILYDDPFDESAGDDDVSDKLANDMEHVTGAYFDMRIQVDQDAPALAGLDYEARGAFFSGHMWVYAKANHIPADLTQENPLVGAYLAMYKDGLLLELGDLTDWARNQDREAAAQSIVDVQQAMLDEDDLAELQKLADVDWSAVVAQSGAAAGGVTDGQWGGWHPIIVSGDQISVSSNAEINALLSDLLTGQADADDFEQLASLIEESAGNVTVMPQGDGVHLLQATDFNLEGTGLDGDDMALLEKMTLEIAYAEDDGMLWAAVHHLGDYDGTIRFEQTDITADDPRFSGERYREDGVTKVIDLSGLLSMFKMLGE